METQTELRAAAARLLYSDNRDTADYNMLIEFIDGTFRENQEQVETDKWIPVTDHLPKNDYGKHWKERAYYLVRLSNGTMRVAHYGYKEYDWWIDSHDCVLSKKHYTEVTHWRQLPEQPKEGE